MKVKTAAKVNLNLSIQNSTDSKLHKLDSLIVPIDLYDEIDIHIANENRDNIVFTNNMYIPIQPIPYSKSIPYNILGYVNLFTLDYELNIDKIYENDCTKFIDNYNNENRLNNDFNRDMYLYLIDYKNKDKEKITFNVTNINDFIISNYHFFKQVSWGFSGPKLGGGKLDNIYEKPTTSIYYKV